MFALPFGFCEASRAKAAKKRKGWQNKKQISRKGAKEIQKQIREVLILNFLCVFAPLREICF